MYLGGIATPFQKISVANLPEGLKNKADSKRQQASSRQLFQKVDFVLDEYTGIGYFSKLIFDKETLSTWRESVDNVFSTLYLGTDYWASQICAHQYDKTVEGVSFVETPLGMLKAAAHIQARISAELDEADGSKTFLYQITTHVKPLEGDVSFNIKLLGPAGSDLLFEDFVKVKEGGSYTASGDTSIVKYIGKKYNTICIVFADKGIFDGDICNKVI